MIRELDLKIYPTKLWLAKYSDRKKIKSRFIDCNEDELDLSVCDSAEGITFNVIERNIKKGEKGRDFGPLIALSKDISEGNIAHEAAHAAVIICDELGIKIDINNDEPFCYLIGFITSEIRKFLNK